MNLTKGERKYIEGSIDITYQKDYHKSGGKLFTHSVLPLESAVEISRDNKEDSDVVMFEPVVLFLERLNELEKEG